MTPFGRKGKSERQDCTGIVTLGRWYDCGIMLAAVSRATAAIADSTRCVLEPFQRVSGYSVGPMEEPSP